MAKDILSLEDSNICNQHISSITNFYPYIKLHSPSHINVNSPLKNSSKNLKVYHQNIRRLKGKTSHLSNILYSELPHLPNTTEHHLINLEIDMKSNILNLVPNFVGISIKTEVYVYLCMNPSTSILFPLTMLFRD